MELDFKKKKRVSNGRGKGFETLNEQDKMNEQILFRVQTEQKRLIDEVCKHRNMSTSDLMRYYVQQGLKKDVAQNPSMF